MSIEIQIINIINDKLRNPIYTTLKLLNLKTILAKSNFTKKEKLIPLVSTDLEINDEEIIETYKRRWT